MFGKSNRSKHQTDNLLNRNNSKGARGSFWFLAAALLAALGAWGCRDNPAEKSGKDAPPLYVVTIPPLGMILSELVGSDAEVHVLLPPKSSPHTYEPRPSDARLAERAAAFFYVAPALDGWAAKLASKNKIEVFALLPRSFQYSFNEPGHTPSPYESHPPVERYEEEPDDELIHTDSHGLSANEKGITSGTHPCDHPDHAHHHDHVHDASCDHDHSGGPDPHFWTDPLTVRALLPELSRVLIQMNPEREEMIARNAARFAERLSALNLDVYQQLIPLRGRPVFLFHPSFLYFLRRYELRYAGVIAHVPGKETSPRELQALVQRILSEEAKAIFSEPQLSPRPALALAEAAGVRMAILDPIGGEDATRTYEQLIRYNATVLREALE
jgi:zinc transport system substrate-binding protein